MAGNSLARKPDAVITAGANDPLARVLKQYQDGRFNVAAPITAIDSVPPMHRVSIRIVRIDEATETYPIPGRKGKVGLGKTALDKIAAAAGISWIPERSGQIDDYRDPHRVKYRAVGEIRDFDGSRRVISGEKEIDLRGEPDWPEEELGSEAREYIRIARKAGPQRDGASRDPWNQILSARQHIHSLAETKAKLRAVRAALAIPTAMDRGEIGLPWVVPQLVPDLPLDDPEIRRAVVASMLGAQAALYGPPVAVPADADAIPLAPGTPTPADRANTAQGEAPAEIDAIPTESRGQGDPAVVAAGGDGDPWDEESPPSPSSSPELPLPVPDATLMEIPTHDERRMRYLLKLNAYAETLLKKAGAVQGAILIDRVTGGRLDPLGASLDEIAKVGLALAAEISKYDGGEQ